MTRNARAVTPGLAALVCLTAACAGRPGDTGSTKHLVSEQTRDSVLARARVWQEPASPIERADLSLNPPGPFRDTDDVPCTFVAEDVSGTTPKFHCRTTDGLDLKIKYGEANPELPGETAASRLLFALGFPVDHLFRVHSVRCLGCPQDPFSAMQCVEAGGTRDRCFAGAKPDVAVVFNEPTIERPLEGRPVDSTPGQGWSWYELDRINPSVGGAPRAEVDALRLMAVLLVHWDNKGSNQRLICNPGSSSHGDENECPAAIALVQDLGATFGPLKVDLPNWQHTPMWKDARACVVSMKSLPYGGGTFGDHAISEEGRQFAVRLLGRLTHAQVRGLFAGSGVTRLNQIAAAAHDPDEWTRTFFDKVQAIELAGPCPSAATLAARGQ
jgi:hypothetical protein